MKLVEIAKGVSINPEKVIAVKKEGRLMESKDANGRDCLLPSGIDFEVYVYTQELIGEYSDFSALVYSAKEKSDYPYAETIKRLEVKK